MLVHCKGTEHKQLNSQHAGVRPDQRIPLPPYQKKVIISFHESKI